MRVSVVLPFLLSLVLAVSANLHAHVARKHHVGRSQLAALGNESTLAKRMSNARFSYYATGLGACGKTNSPSDFVRPCFMLFSRCIRPFTVHVDSCIKFGSKYTTLSTYIVTLIWVRRQQYGSGSFCFDMITITCRGKTAQAQITDEVSFPFWMHFAHANTIPYSVPDVPTED